MTSPAIRFTPVHGTWHRQAPWMRPDSELIAHLAGLGLELLDPDDPFYWSGDAGGWQFWRRWGWGRKDGDIDDWIAGGGALRWKLRMREYLDRGLIVHSHGLWPAIVAMAQGLDVPWMISVGSPARADMERYVQDALPHLGAWLHVYDRDDDGWGRRGGFGDGRLSLKRCQRFAGVHNTRGVPQVYTLHYPRRGGNDALEGIGHSGVLNNPRLFHLWKDRGWVDFTRPAPMVAA